MDSKLIVEHGEYKIIINPETLTAYKAWDCLDAIKSLHVEKFKIFELMEKCDSKDILKNYAEYIELLEFKLQKAWGLPEDKKFHQWYNVPKCICPKIDNKERIGTEYRVVMNDCPVHGS